MSKKYTNDHEWAELKDGLVTIGITDFAQQQLGEVVFVELPEIDREVSAGEEAAVVESVKAAGEVKAPIAGTVVAVNEALVDKPEMVNDDPAGEGWFYQIRPADEAAIAGLMDQQSYDDLVASLA